MGEPFYPLSVSCGSKPCLLCYLSMYEFTPQTCPIRWCTHLCGYRSGVRGFYPDLRPSQAVDRRRTLYNTVVHCLYNLHYLLHTHHIGLIESLGGLATPLVKKLGVSPYFNTPVPSRGDTESGIPHGQRIGDRGAFFQDGTGH